MTRRKKMQEDGSAALVGMASVTALALVTLMVQQVNNRTKGSIDEAKEMRGREASTIGADNSLARFKALISPRKQSDGTYIPTVFASNYYSPEWKLKQKANTTSNNSFEFRENQATGTVKAGKQDIKSSEVRTLMAGSSLQTLPGLDSFGIDVIKPNFEDDPNSPGFGKLVTSVDVKVSGKSEIDGKSRVTKVAARVSVAPPKPFNTKIMYRKKGTLDTLKEVKEGEDLSGGEFEFFIVTSGVAYYGILYVDGNEVTRTVGFGPDGKITHKAVNYEAKDVPISEAIPLKLRAEAADQQAASSGDANEVDQGDSFNQSTCTYVPPGAGGGGGGTVAAGGSVTGTKTMKAVVYGPDGKTKDATKELKVKAEAPAAAGKTNDGKTTLTQNDYANLCSGENECTWVASDSGNGAELGRVASYFRPTKDISSSYTFKQGQDPGKWGIFKKKVCFNFSKADNSTHNLVFSQAIVVVYDTATCTKKNLFQRSSCGCVTADTRITLGDGISEKRIDEIMDQDLVWNPILRKAFPIRKISRGPEKIPMISIVVGGKEIRATGNHPFNGREGFIPAYRLQAGDEILVDGTAYLPIEEVRSIPVEKGEEPPVVWNIEIDAPDDDHDAHHLVANGITTGDLMIQMKLQSGLLK